VIETLYAMTSGSEPKLPPSARYHEYRLKIRFVGTDDDHDRMIERLDELGCHVDEEQFDVHSKL